MRRKAGRPADIDEVVGNRGLVKEHNHAEVAETSKRIIGILKGIPESGGPGAGEVDVRDGGSGKPGKRHDAKRNEGNAEVKLAKIKQMVSDAAAQGVENVSGNVVDCTSNALLGTFRNWDMYWITAAHLALL